MTQMGGLFELVIVFAIVLAWGIIELRSTRLDRKKAEASRNARDEQPPS